MDVSPHALDVPDIDSYIGLMHTLFTLEDLYGLTVSESDEDICLKVDTSKDKDAHELWKMLYAWKEQADKLSSEEISKDKYDQWRYHYPEFDTTQTWAKIPSQALSAFCRVQRTPMRFRADAVQSTTDALKQCIFSYSRGFITTV